MPRKKADPSAPKAPRKNAAKPKAAAVAPDVAPEAAKAPKPVKASAASIKRHFHEPYGRDCWDVHYEVNGEAAVDKGFLSAEAAQAHADSLA